MHGYSASVVSEAPWRKALSDSIAETFRRIAPVKGKALLFGSRARGDNRPDSDWDVVLLIDKDSMTIEEKGDLTYPLWELGLDYDQDVNAFVYTTKEWNARSFMPFYKNVMKDGVPL